MRTLGDASQKRAEEEAELGAVGFSKRLWVDVVGLSLDDILKQLRYWKRMVGGRYGRKGEAEVR